MFNGEGIDSNIYFLHIELKLELILEVIDLL